MIIRPKSGTGAKTALLAPITIRASFLSIRFHSESFWLGVNPECNTATVDPKRIVTASITCGVNPISGTR